MRNAGQGLIGKSSVFKGYSIVAGFFVIASMLTFACQSIDHSPPVIAEMAPSSTVFGTVLSVEIRGHNLLPSTERDISCSGDPIAIEEAFEAKLGAVALQNVLWDSPTRLTARIPATLAVGVYDLVVTDPFDEKLILPQAFTVLPADDTDSQSDGATDDSDTQSDDSTDESTEMDAGADAGEEDLF